MFRFVARFARVRIEDSSLNRFALNSIQRDFFRGLFFPGGFFPGGFFPGGFYPVTGFRGLCSMTPIKLNFIEENAFINATESAYKYKNEYNFFSNQSVYECES